VRRDKVHCHKPLAEANLGVLEDSANSNGEVLATLLADVSTFCCHISVCATTVRAYSLTIAPTFLSNGLLADFLRREIICNLNE
jgi:hypothetical protein